MQDYEEWEFELEDIDEEELLLTYLENTYPVTVLGYLLECKKFVEQWEWNCERFRKLQEKSATGEASLQVLTEEEIQKYGFTQEEVEELNDYADINSDAYKEAEKNYRIEKEFCRLVKESPNVQEQLLKIIENLEYDNEDEKSIIKVVYTLAGMIKIGNEFRKDSDEQNESTEEMWQKINEAIAEKLRELTAKEFICVLEIGGAEALIGTKEYQEVIVEKILEMTEIEFMQYLEATGDYEKVEAIKLAEKEKLKIADPVFAQLYVHNDVESDTVLRLLEGIKSFDKIEVLSSIVNFDDERIIKKVYQMIRELTTEQVVKYFAISKSDETDSGISEILIERLKDLSDEDIKTLLCVYKYQQDEEFQNEVLKCARERGLCEGFDDIVETGEISTRIISIQETSNAIDELPMSILGVGWEYVGQIDNEEDDVIRWLLDDYQKHSEAVAVAAEYWEYIRRLSKMDLKSLIKTIIKVNQQVKKEKEEFEKNSEVNIIDENEIDDEEETEEDCDILREFETKESARQRFCREILNSLEIYLKNRILEADDERTIKMLGLIFIDEREPFHNVVKEKSRQILVRKRDTTGNEENGGGSGGGRE